jgi:hypothetical protein
LQLPVSDKSKEHVVVDLGIVELRRRYYQAHGMPLISKLHFKAQVGVFLFRSGLFCVVLFVVKLSNYCVVG